MKKIMLIDDDPAIRHALTLVFPADQYVLDIHPDGRQLLSGDYQKPDIFLLDKQLNGVDGLELCRILKADEATKLIPVIVLSASPYIRGPAIAAGADAVLEKPFSVSALRQILADHFI